QAAKPCGAAIYDVWDIHKGLDVVDDSGLAPEPADLRIGWLRAWDCTVALERGQHRSLVAANIASGAAVQMELQVEPRSQDILAEIAFGARLIDGTLQTAAGKRVFGAQEDVGDTRLDREGADDGAFDQL